MVDKFRYGTTFQTKIISSMMSDSIFMKRIIDIIDVKYFENDIIQNIIHEIIEYFHKYKMKPTFDSLKTIFIQPKYSQISNSSIQIIIDAQSYLDSSDLDYVKDSVIQFCRHQEIKRAILQSVDLLNNDKFDIIEKMMNDSFKIGLDINTGINIKRDVDLVFTDDKRNPVATPWEQINNITEGGLGLGELGVIAAPPGIGKSWALVSLASHAIKQGKKVVFFTLELYENYVAKRFYSNLTHTKLNNLKYEVDAIKTYLNHLKGELIIQYYPTKSVSVNSLKGFVERSITEEFKPDLIIVDYADLLKAPYVNSTKRDDQILGDIYAELRGMAGEFEIPVWTASQINRSGAKSQVIESDSIAGSFEKIMIADIVVSISRQLEDKIANTSRWHILKNRFGRDGVTFPAQNDLSMGKIQLFEPTTEKGKEVSNSTEMASKKFMRNKYKQFL